MTKKFESENIYIEYNLNEVPLEEQAELIEKVNLKMQIFLEAEEKKIRDKYGEPDRSTRKSQPTIQHSVKSSNNKSKDPTKQYDIEITSKGRRLQKSLSGEFKVEKETSGDFQNFIHLWFHTSQKLYVGFLHKINGKFKFKEENKSKIEQLQIEQGVHFRITELARPTITN